MAAAVMLGPLLALVPFPATQAAAITINWPSAWSNPIGDPSHTTITVNSNWKALSVGCDNADMTAPHTYYLPDGTKAHLAIDADDPQEPFGTPRVNAIADGTIRFNGTPWAAGWGDAVTIVHTDSNGSDFTATYAHIDIDLPPDRDGAAAGHQVNAGEQIGELDDDGFNLENEHLHFEIRPGDLTSGPPGTSTTTQDQDDNCTIDSLHGTEDPIPYLTARTPATGNPTDSDGDGVPDNAPDLCDNTPAGWTVDADGCPIDGDDDGVADDLPDLCPQTPAGTEVDANGCDAFLEVMARAKSIATGDVNGDGHDDVILGVPGENLGGLERAGAVVVVYGSPSGVSNASAHDSLNGAYGSSSGLSNPAETGDYFGAAVATGYINDDEFADIVIGIPGEDVGSIRDAGAVTVVYGSASGVDNTSPHNTIASSYTSGGLTGAGAPTAEAHDRFGAAVAVGDLNNDQFDDLIVGTPGEDIGTLTDAGAVTVIYASTTGVSDTSSHDSLNGSHSGGGGLSNDAEAGDRLGAAIATGNINGDLYDDIIIGIPGEDLGAASDAGAVIAVHGGSTGVDNSSTHSVLNGSYTGASGLDNDAEAGDQLGAAVATGNINGDLYDDIIIGIPGEDLGSASDAGAVIAVHGATGGVDNTSTHSVLNGTYSGGTGLSDSTAEAGDQFGAAVATGNINGDLYDDIIIGIPGEDLGSASDAGAVVTVHGSAGGANNLSTHQPINSATGSGGLSGTGAETGDQFGGSVTAGDVNSDGFADPVVGIPGEDIAGSVDAGAAMVVCGSAGGAGNGNDHRPLNGAHGTGQGLTKNNAESGDQISGLVHPAFLANGAGSLSGGASTPNDACDNRFRIRPYGTVIAEGTGVNPTANAVIYLEDHNGDPITATEPVTATCFTGDNAANPLVAHPGEDFIATSQTITFNPGDTQAHLPIEIIADAVDEPPLLYGEWGLLACNTPSANATIDTTSFFGLGILIIIDDD